MSEACGACEAPLPPADSPARSGWLTGTLRRYGSQGLLSDILVELVACPRHGVHVMPRQLVALANHGPGLTRPVTPAMAAARGCAACPLFADLAWEELSARQRNGWAIIRLHRLQGASDQPLVVRVCPEHSVEVR